MTTVNRGTKYACPECASKYYDMGKAVVLCPRCGAKPPVAKALRSGRPAGAKASRPKFNRYP